MTNIYWVFPTTYITQFLHSTFYRRHIWAEIQALKVHKGTNYFLVAQNECSWNLLSCYASLAAKLLGKWRRNLAAAAWHLLRPDSIRISWQSIAATDMFVSKCAFGMLTNWRTNRTTFSLFLKKEYTRSMIVSRYQIPKQGHFRHFGTRESRTVLDRIV